MKHLKLYEEFNWFKSKKEEKYDSIESIQKIEDLLIKSRNNFDKFMKNGQGSWFIKFEDSVEEIIDLLEIMDKNREGRTRYYLEKLGAIVSNFDIRSFKNKNINKNYMIKLINLIQKYNIKKLSNG